MGKGNVRLEELTRQNDLLREQNDLLREQNEILRGTSAASSSVLSHANGYTSSGHEIFIDNIDRDEMRNGFLVTSNRKKVWNVQIGLIREFARICKKYNLRWFAYYGTLLGAARHKGFIPWDDDSDVVMFREDYEKFKEVAKTEVKPPYFSDDWANYRREDSENTFLESEANLPFIRRELERRVGWPFCYPSIKFRDSRTTMIAYPERPGIMNQGIFIDIFPLDATPPFSDKKDEANFRMARFLFQTISYPEKIREMLEEGSKFILAKEQLKKFLRMSHKQKVNFLETFLRKNFQHPECVNQLRDWSIVDHRYSYNVSDFDGIVYLPFEKIEVPAPIGWENILTQRYGDWHKMIYTHTHSMVNSADISYDEYFAKVAKKTLIMNEEGVPRSILLEENTDLLEENTDS